jgi:hypothetical protein
MSQGNFMPRFQDSTALIIATMSASLIFVGCQQAGPDFVDTSEGITFIRTYENLNDAVAHRVTIFVGDDACLYVDVADDKTYLAAVSPDAKISRTEMKISTGSYPLSQEVALGRMNTQGIVPPELSHCTLATEAWGLG